MTLIEICVDDLDGVRIAAEAGADRVELCDALDVGGLTPPVSLVRQAVSVAPAGGLQVIVRSRAGDFVYTPEEVQRISDDMRMLRQATEGTPVRVGFVVGAVTQDGQIDEAAAASFREAAGERPLTFHRAFDVLADQRQGLEVLVALGYERVLTTGGDPSVVRVDSMRDLVEQADGRIQIIASGGLRSHNVARIVSETQAPEIHMRAPHPSGGTDPFEVRSIVSAVRAGTQ